MHGRDGLSGTLSEEQSRAWLCSGDTHFDELLPISELRGASWDKTTTTLEYAAFYFLYQTAGFKLRLIFLCCFTAAWPRTAYKGQFALNRKISAREIF